MNDLKITERMLQNAKSNKSVGWLYIDPVQFLSLTVTEHNVYDWIEKELPETKTLEQYNSYEGTLMPWLDVDMHTGKVVGHEGRHRAAACIKSGCKRLPISICLRDHGYPHYYSQPYIKDHSNPKQLMKVFVTKEDVPKVLVGQFVHRSVIIDTKHIKEFWADHNTASVTAAGYAGDVDGTLTQMARIIQGAPATAPGVTPNCWQRVANFVKSHSIHVGSILLFGHTIGSKPYVAHAILLDAHGKVIYDSYGRLGGYDKEKGYWVVEANEHYPLIKSVPVSELLHRQLESSFVNRSLWSI